MNLKWSCLSTFNVYTNQLTPRGCPLTSSCMPWHVCTHTINKHIQKDIGKRNKKKVLDGTVGAGGQTLGRTIPCKERKKITFFYKFGHKRKERNLRIIFLLLLHEEGRAGTMGWGRGEPDA